METGYVDLGEIDGYKKEMTAGEIAKLLRGKEWNIDNDFHCKSMNK